MHGSVLATHKIALRVTLEKTSRGLVHSGSSLDRVEDGVLLDRKIWIACFAYFILAVVGLCGNSGQWFSENSTK